MPSPPAHFGVYEIRSLVDRGGMGEVYLARDTRLDRDVALKILPDVQASDAERRARFEREARTLASLNHPNIAAIYGVEESTPASPGGEGAVAIVMELIDGETLAERLRRGPLPLEAALRLAAQIAAALEAAHRKGIVHRDLKPANIKITAAGTVKVLDFGLAKLLEDPGQNEVTVSAMTAAGVVVGTPAYMSPEQAQGQAVDTRADIWAFGVVLFEMMTGIRPFGGRTIQETLSAILTADPDWTRVPARLQPLIRVCLARDPAERLRDIADYRFLLAPGDTPDRRAGRSPWRIWAMAATVVVAIALGFFAGRLRVPAAVGPPPPEVPLRLSTMMPVGVSVTRGPGYTSSVAISPDGRTVVIAASDKDEQRLYRRSLDRLEPEPLDGTDGGSSPFFSWDGQWIGFFADGRLKRIPAAGGATADIAEAPGFSSGASWGPDDRIVFAYGATSFLYVVSADGGPVARLTDRTTGRQPEALPDGRTVLFESAGQIRAYDRRSGAITTLLPGTAPRYANGHVIFSRGTTLFAAPLNLETSTVGTAVPVEENVAIELPGSGGGRHFAISRSGVLVYVPAAEAYELVVIGPEGNERMVGRQQRSLENPRFSPDGRHVVVAARRRDGEPADLWTHDLETGATSRLTSDGGRAAVWGGDASTITYSHLGEQQGIYTTRADGSGNRQRVLPQPRFHWLVGWTPDRTGLVYGEMGVMNESSIRVFDGAAGEPRTVVPQGNVWGGRLSRDGKWLAYYGLNAGRFELYVTPFPGGDGRWLVTEGTDPAWSPDGSEIYYRSGPRLMAGRLDKSTGIRLVSSRVVVDPYLPPLYDDYDIHPNGRSLVIVRPANQAQGREITVVLGWVAQFGRS